MSELRFLSNEAGEGEGLSDAGIETYRADPFPAVARETGQNSRDAHDKARCADKPVRMEIQKLNVPTASLPNVDQYRAAVDNCLRVARDRGVQKEINFFEHAQRVLGSAEIPVLMVADFQTKGLLGPRQEGSPFHSLVKSSGVSNKEDDTSGGSFGIGKSAVYAASDLQTVFYSTSYIDKSGQRRFACQGKTKFRSFATKAGDQFRSVGYWGDPNGFMPIEDPALAPDWLGRNETGTTVYSVAVRETDDWQKEMIASVLMNFFSAISVGRMEFKIDGDEITANTLRHRFDDPAIRSAAKAKSEDFDFSHEMYRCLMDDAEAEEHLLDIPGAGVFRLRLLIRDGLPKRVGILRNGMYVCDNLAHFGEKFSRFPMYRDFVALVEPENDAGNVWLRAMENPRHDEFSPERLLDPQQRKTARLAGEQLARSIREKIRAVAKAKAERETDLDELSEFFALDNEGKKDDKGFRDVTTFEVTPVPQKTRRRRSKAPIVTVEGDEGGAGGNREGNGGGGGGKGPGHGEGEGGSGSRSRRRPLPLRDPRTFLTDRADPTKRRICFTPEASGEAILSFESSGLSDPAPLLLASGECRVNCVAGKRQEVEVEFLTAYDGPIEISSWEAGGNEK